METIAGIFPGEVIIVEAGCTSGLVDKGRGIWKDFVRIYGGVAVRFPQTNNYLMVSFLPQGFTPPILIYQRREIAPSRLCFVFAVDSKLGSR
jgi:hypothetical protein